MKWFRYYDMSSGGTEKTPYSNIYVEAASRPTADVVFTAHTGRDPGHTTCACCGEDYTVYEYTTIDEATADERGGQSVRQYVRQPDVLVIRNAPRHAAVAEQALRLRSMGVTRGAIVAWLRSQANESFALAANAIERDAHLAKPSAEVTNGKA